MYLCFGMPVLGSDGEEAGALECVLLAPKTREVTHVVVRSPRVSEDVLLPMSLVQGSAGERLLLHVGSDDLGSLPRYYEGRTSAPPAGRVDTALVPEPAARRAELEAALAVAPDALELGPETAITTTDGSDGLLVGVQTEEYVHCLSALGLSGLCNRDVLLPADLIGSLHSGAIAVQATCDQLGQLPSPQWSRPGSAASDRRVG